MLEERIAAELDHYEQRRSMRVEADIASGVPLGEAVAEIRRLAADLLPAGANMILQGDPATLQESISCVDALYREGLSGFIDVLDAQRTLVSIQEALVEAETDYANAIVALHTALGGETIGAFEVEQSSAPRQQQSGPGLGR